MSGLSPWNGRALEDESLTAWFIPVEIIPETETIVISRFSNEAVAKPLQANSALNSRIGLDTIVDACFRKGIVLEE